MRNRQHNTLELIRREVNELATDHVKVEWQDLVDQATGTIIQHAVKLPKQPLLTQMRQAVYSDTGKTHAGHSQKHTRNLIDLGAFDIYQEITDRVFAHYRWLTEKSAPTAWLPEKTLLDWYVRYRYEAERQRYTEDMQKEMLTEIRSWSRRIRGHFDPPRQMELFGPCPMCEGLDDKKGHTALFLQWRKDEPATARCRLCKAEWSGTVTLLQLGYHLGANVDEQSLTEMGIL